MPLNSPTPEPIRPGLYVVTTPIGNLGDITLRALQVLGQADLVAAEDTRHTRLLLKAHGIEKRLVSYHEHNEGQRARELVERLVQGATVALVSNAGTPTVSDPGFRLVRAAIDHRIAVIPIPGVSAAITALSASGLPTDQFTFIGFPARKAAKRGQQLQALKSVCHTVVFYQSPRRLTRFIEELIAIFGDRDAVLAREMTKLHEEFLRGRLSEILAALGTRETIRGECTLLVSGDQSDDAPDEAEIDQAIRAAMENQERPLSDMAKSLASRFGVSRKRIYDRALALKSSANR